MQQTIIIGVILISFVFLVLGISLFLVLKKYYFDKAESTRKTFEAIIYAQEKERQRIAQDIHDELGSLLTSLGLFASNLSSNSHNDEEKDLYIHEIVKLINKAKKEARNASSALMPESLKKFGLKGAISELESIFYHIQNLKFEISYELDEPISQFVQIQLYRIIIELVTNAIKYANANCIYIDIFTTDGVLILQIKDDGCGFDIEKTLNSENANGLIHTFSRVKSLNGINKSHSIENNGSSFVFQFEMKKLLAYAK